MFRDPLGRTWVEVDHDIFGVVQEIRDRWPQLQVQFCNPDLADPSDAPYRIIEMGRDGQWYEVMAIWEMDRRVIDRLYDSDITRTDVLRRVEESERKAREEQKLKELAEFEEANDIATHALTSRQSKYKIHNSKGELVEMDLYYKGGRTDELDG